MKYFLVERNIYDSSIKFYKAALAIKINLCVYGLLKSETPWMILISIHPDRYRLDNPLNKDEHFCWLKKKVILSLR
jgi:hypothetical protein